MCAEALHVRHQLVDEQHNDCSFIFFNKMLTKCSKYTISKMYTKKLKIMSKFNNSLRITFSVRNNILLNSRIYWGALSCVCAGTDYSSETLLKGVV